MKYEKRIKSGLQRTAGYICFGGISLMILYAVILYVRKVILKYDFIYGGILAFGIVVLLLLTHVADWATWKAECNKGHDQ